MSQIEAELPNARSLKGLCTRCGHLSQFKFSGSYFLADVPSTSDAVQEIASMLQCLGCNEYMFVFSKDVTPGNLNGEELSFPFFYYPPPGSSTLDASVPKKIASCFDEGQKCLSVGAYRAAVVMFRSALAEFVSSNASPTATEKKDLYARLEAMASEGDLHPSLVDWAKSIRLLGNEGAHSERYENVTKDEALAIASLMRQLLILQFEVPSRLERARTKASIPTSPELSQ